MVTLYKRATHSMNFCNSHYGQTSPTSIVVPHQSREVNEDDEEEDEGFRDAEEIMETAMSLKERRHEYRKLLGATAGLS